MPAPAVLFAGLLFGAVGLAAFLYGKKHAKFAPLLIGLVLAVLPYAVDDARLLYAAGLGLCGALYWLRD